MKTLNKKALAMVVASVMALSLTGCGTAVSSPAQASIVATTNVWADIAEQVAGEYFEVTALISDPAIDPHSFEASARDQLAVSESSLFIMNGGGYDEFAEVLATAAKVEPFDVFEEHEAAQSAEPAEEGAEHEHAEEGAEHEHAHDGSDHIWYDLHVVEHAAKLIALELGKIQPENAEKFTANAAAFAGEIETLESSIQSFDESLSYFEAHPLATMLFNELGFSNLTPEGFAEAEEAGLEPSVKIMSEASSLIEQKEIDFLAINRQVTSPSLERLKTLAQENGVAILTFDELLPNGQSYQEWVRTLLTQLETAR